MTKTGRADEGKKKPRIGITIGDPAGIGPEVSLKAAANREVQDICVPTLIGDARYLAYWSEIFGVRQRFNVIENGRVVPDDLAAPAIYDLNNLGGSPDSIISGKEQASCGKAAGEYIETAVRLCQRGELEAIVTAPINKKSLHLGGYPYPGHTEFLAHLTDSRDFAMAFISPAIRVALLTTHVPLKAVSSYVKKGDLMRLIRLVHREMTGYGFERPRIALAAINPHGGEGSLFGSEEAAEMTPAVEECRSSDGIDVTGPHSGDTVFTRAARGEFDIVISCYHDQGLIPVKCFSFGEAVNVTLGLPFIRTSVDHGTAFDIAGKGQANHLSMVAAIKLAAELHQRRKV